MKKDENNTAKPVTNSMEVTLSMPDTESLGLLENATLGMSRTITYKTQEEWQELKGVPVRCYFMGLKEVPNDKGEAVLCAGFMSKKETFLAAQIVLVDAVRGLSKNTPVEIVFLGKKENKSSDGKTNLFSVNLLEF